jgi:hypothetical protein
VKTTIRMMTNPTTPVLPFCVDLKITDEYVHRPPTPKLLYVRASETFGKLDIDPRKIEKTPNHLELCSIGRGVSDERFRQETARILENKYKHHIKVYTDGSNKEDRLGYSVIWNQQNIKKRIRPQNTIFSFSAEQSAIITVLYTTMRDSENKLIATDSLSKLIAAMDKKETKNPKTRIIRNLLGQ